MEMSAASPSAAAGPMGATSASTAASKWQEACQRCKGLLDSKDAATILTIPSYQHLKTAVDGMERTYKDKKTAKVLERMTPFLEKIMSFSGVVDTAVQAGPDVGALLWGGIKLVLEVCVHDYSSPPRSGVDEAGWVVVRGSRVTSALPPHLGGNRENHGGL